MGPVFKHIANTLLEAFPAKGRALVRKMSRDEIEVEVMPRSAASQPGHHASDRLPRHDGGAGALSRALAVVARHPEARDWGREPGCASTWAGGSSRSTPSCATGTEVEITAPAHGRPAGGAAAPRLHAGRAASAQRPGPRARCARWRPHDFSGVATGAGGDLSDPVM